MTDIKTECSSEIGVTVGLIDGIINSVHLLKERDLSSHEVKEAIKDLCSQELLAGMLINSYEYGEEFWKYPEKYVPISDVGHDRVINFYGRFAVSYLVKVMPIFNRAYDLLTKMGKYSEKDAFGEMHGDRYLWIEKHDTIKVLVLKEQSHSFIYIKDGCSFYIRALEYGKEATEIKKYRSQNFKLGKALYFKYGDGRDRKHVFSCGMVIEKVPKGTSSNELVKALQGVSESSTTDNPNYHTIHAIEQIAEWEYYLDNPDECT